MFGTYPRHKLERVKIIEAPELSYTVKKIPDDLPYRSVQEDIYNKMWNFKHMES
jgi:hypothetical protein